MPSRKFWSIAGVFLLITLTASCGFKRIGPFYFDTKCHRDLPRIWKGVSCPTSNPTVSTDPGEVGNGGKEGGGTPTLQCELAINPSLCIRDGIEHSVWRSQLRQASILLQYSLSYQSYYEFQPDGQYTHYLVFTHPFLSKRYYEKRHGVIDLQRNDVIDSVFWAYTLDFNLNTSSCEGHATPSLFSLFDQSNKSQIRRVQRQLSLLFPDIDFDVAIQSFDTLILALVLNFTEIGFEILFAPLTPNFWKEVITGPLSWDEKSADELASTLAGAEEMCFSEDGFQALLPKVKIPPEVQFILQSR